MLKAYLVAAGTPLTFSHVIESISAPFDLSVSLSTEWNTECFFLKRAFLAFSLYLSPNHKDTHAVFWVPWGRVDTGSQPVGRRPRTSEEVHLPVQWKHSNPEPAAAASAPPVDCPWKASALPGSIFTGAEQWLIINPSCELNKGTAYTMHSFIYSSQLAFALAWVGFCHSTKI